MKKAILLLASFFMTTISFSQSITGEDEIYNQYKIENKKLNIVYLKLKSKLNKKRKIELINAQKAWNKFRDDNWKFKSKQRSIGVAIANKMKFDCLIQTTIKRTKELTDLVHDFKP